jgi:hypothetical protein
VITRQPPEHPLLVPSVSQAHLCLELLAQSRE